MAAHDQRIQAATEGELFRLLVENVHDYAIFVMDPEGRVRSWNPGAERLLGYSEAEVVGRPAALFFTAEDIHGGVPQREMAKAVETGRDEDARWHVRKDGGRFWSSGTITPLWDEGRNLRGFAKIMRDGTSQKHSAEALKDALAYAERVVDTVPEPMLVLGGDLRVRTANRSFYQNFRASAAETEGRFAYDLGERQWDIPKLRTLLEEILPQNTFFDGFEVEHYFRAIGRKVMLLNARCITQEGNQPELILLAIEDITGRRRAEEEREETETHFTSLVKDIKDHAIFTIDPNEAITSGNREAERILGYSETEMLGQPFSLIFTAEDIRDGIPGRELRNARETGRAVNERWHERKGGELFWALGIVTPTHDAQGRHTGFSKILRDMTEQKLAEEELQRTHDEAEAQVGETTAELKTANEQLQMEVAERRRSQDALRRSEARKAAIVDVSLDAIIKIDHEGKVVEFNPAAERTFGYSRADMLGKELAEFIVPPSLREKHRRGLAHYLATGEGPVLGERLEMPAMRADGTEFPIELVIVRIPGGGSPIFTGFIRDVSERKLAERRAKVQHDTTKAIAESATLESVVPIILEAVCKCLEWAWAGVWMVDSQGERIVLTQFWNSPGGNLEEFVATCRDMTFSRGEGLPGRVWATGEPAWLPDVTRDGNFPRKETAARCGLHGAFAFPIMCGLEVFCVMELFSRRNEQPDEELSAMMTDIGSQIGQFIERKAKEEALWKSEERFRELTAHLHQSLWVFDTRQSKVLYVSPGYERIWGRSCQSLLDNPHLFMEGIHPLDLGMMTGESARIIETGRIDVECRVLRPDESVRWVWIRGYPVTEQGRIVRVVGVVEDVTEKRLLAEQRDSLLSRLQLHIERMPLAYVLFDADLRISDWNPTAERIFGYSKQEALGMGPFDLAPPSFRHEAEEMIRRLRGGDMEASSVNENVTRDGRTITCEWFNTPLVEEDGEFVGWISLAQDITSRREAEKTLLLRDGAIRAVSQGILITDPSLPDNPIIYASPGFERITGYEAKEVLGRNCRLLQGKETDPEAVDAIRQAIRAGREASVELVNYRKDGTKFWNALSVTPVRGEDQRIEYFVGVQADVTARRTLEEAFHQSQKMEAVGQLAGGVAHDFNNLLTIISGYSEIILSKLPSEAPMREFVQSISVAGERAASLTRQLLAFSRKTVLEPKVLDLNEVVRETGKMLRRLIGEDILLTTVLDPTISRVKVDPDQLGQVLMNLTVNARDAMPRGGNLTLETKTVELDQEYARLRPDVEPGRYVLLAVSDTGSGMTAQVKAQIFEPFFTTKGAGKGTGLGLAVVMGIVKQSGGHVEVHSDLGRGTTFELYFPAVEEKADAAESHSEVGDERGTETILLVEDEDGVRGLAFLVLQTHGYKVLAARDGKDAMRVVAKHQGPIELLVTDVVMPGMGGREVAEALHPRFPEMKLLYTSGYTDDAVVRHGVLRAESAFLQKPYTPRSLAKKVRQVLEQR